MGPIDRDMKRNLMGYTTNNDNNHPKINWNSKMYNLSENHMQSLPIKKNLWQGAFVICQGSEKNPWLLPSMVISGSNLWNNVNVPYIICLAIFSGDIHLHTWWLIPLSKWVITPVINGISRVNPLITGIISYNPLTKWDEPPSRPFFYGIGTSVQPIGSSSDLPLILGLPWLLVSPTRRNFRGVTLPLLAISSYLASDPRFCVASRQGQGALMGTSSNYPLVMSK